MLRRSFLILGVAMLSVAANSRAVAQSSSHGHRLDCPTVEGYRSVSHEAIGIQVGDTVAIKGDDVKLMRGTNVVGVVPNGLEFNVTQVRHGWLGTVVEVNGQKLNGWVRNSDVTHHGEATIASQPSVTDEVPAQSYRRFSYEPSRSYRTSRSSSSGQRRDPLYYKQHGGVPGTRFGER